MTLSYHQAAFKLKDRMLVQIADLNLQDHDLCVLIGRNGCGKSALAKALALKLEALAGTYPASLKAALVSFEDQQQLFEDDFNLRNTDTPNEQEERGYTPRDLIKANALTAQVIEALQISSLLDRPIRTLSGGEGRKILIAKALCEDPDLLILDAPFDALDVQSRAALLEIISYIHLNFKPPVVLMVNRKDEIPQCATQLGIIENLCLTKIGPFAAMRDAEEVTSLLDQQEILVHSLPKAPPKYAAKRVPTDTLVKLTNINISYHRPIFQNFNFELKRGRHCVITGPNGAGKSTLLSLITGDNPLVYTNQVEVFGIRRGSGESIWEIKQYYGYVSGSLHLDYRVSSPVLNVVLSGFYDSIGLYNKAGDEEIKVARQWLKLVGLEADEKKSFKALSFGHQRLLLIVRALVKNPPLLILDEPLQGLDAPARAQVNAFITFIIKNSDTSVLFVSHHEEDIPEGFTDALTFVKNDRGGFDIEQKALK